MLSKCSSQGEGLHEDTVSFGRNRILVLQKQQRIKTLAIRVFVNYVIYKMHTVTLLKILPCFL